MVVSQVEANKDRRERREPPPPPPELDAPLPTTNEGIDAFNATMFNCEWWSRGVALAFAYYILYLYE